MAFLERFFSPDNVHSVILVVGLVYLIKTERRLARLEAVCRLMCPFDLDGRRKEKEDDGD
jgi:hypothetical protein